ncbi:MAG: DUF4401 domain-containing protein [Verrucomicrobiota bacterium]
MSAKQESLWALLRTHELVTGEPPVADETDAPWFVRLMLGFAGWVGALFLLAFLGAGFATILKTPTITFCLGIAVCVVATAIFRAKQKSDFVAQFGLAISLTGQILIAYGPIHWLEGSNSLICSCIALEQVALFFLVPNFTHRIWCAWATITATSLTLTNLGLDAFTPALTTALVAWLTLSEFTLTRYISVVRAAIYGSAIVAIQTAFFRGPQVSKVISGNMSPTLDFGATGFYLGHCAVILVLIGALLTLLKRECVAPFSKCGKIACSATLTLGLTAIKAPGIAPTLTILLLGFANADRLLTGLGIFSLLVYTSYYYYSLESTLLVKSFLLMTLGMVLLLTRILLRQCRQQDPVENTETPNA